MPLSFSIEDVDVARALFGERDSNLEQIEATFGIEIQARGTDLTIRGEKNACTKAFKALQGLLELAERGHPLTTADVRQVLQMIEKNPDQVVTDVFLDQVAKKRGHSFISPRTATQKIYVEEIRKNDIVFGWGPAGTGKTYLAMAMAVSAFLNKDVNRIVLTRPAVEAGEKLGFLPGDLAEKVNPYLRPLYDAMHDMMEPEQVQQYLSNGQIEVAPLAFMRGRTLNKSFVILDEAQNSTREQMKMFLTRLGFDSKAVITGDITQVDLPSGDRSGLAHAMSILGDVDDISFVEFHPSDVVRHPLVQKIILAYEENA
jgi:phosphate starvation-inducible PhoH-like protein